MLVLSVFHGERIWVGPEINIRIDRSSPTRSKVAIEAPLDYRIQREGKHGRPPADTSPHLPLGKLLIDADDASRTVHGRGLCDAIDNDGQPYQSATLAHVLERLRSETPQAA